MGADALSRRLNYLACQPVLGGVSPDAPVALRRIEIRGYRPFRDFAAEFGGAAILQQKANAMYSSERRRLFLVSLEDSGTTMNAHDAFLRNLNLIVNTSDIPQLPLIVNRAVLDFNDLYHYLNKGLGVEPI